MLKAVEVPERGRAAALAGLRAVLTITEEHVAGLGEAPEWPGCRVALAVVVTNPLAGRDAEDLRALVALGGELGRYLAERAARLIDVARIGSLGKAAVVGQAGELEHAAALVGPAFTAAIRKAIGGWQPGAPSTRKVGGPGTIVEVGLHYRDGATGPALPPVEIRVPGHPRDDEAVVVLAVAELGEA